MAHRTLDEITLETEHVRPVHPFRALIENSCFVGDFIDKGGMSLILMDGLILVPIIMFAFFYPLQTLMWLGVAMLVIAAVWEGCVIWRKRHPLKS